MLPTFISQLYTFSPFQHFPTVGIFSSFSMTPLATRWQHDSQLAYLREAEGNSARPCRSLVAYTKTNKRVSRTTP